MMANGTPSEEAASPEGANEGDSGSKINVVESYDLVFKEIKVKVKIIDIDDYVYHYDLSKIQVDIATRAMLDEIKQELVGEVQIEMSDILDPTKFAELREKFFDRGRERLRGTLLRASEGDVAVLSRLLVNEMVGLGDIEYLLADNFIEEIVINNSREEVLIYHKKYKWLKTNISFPNEDVIRNYASRVAREVGREITDTAPLLDAHLITGDRVNATLFPVSTKGNTMTIRRFSRTPWTMVHMIDPKFKTTTSEVSAFLWLAIEYELNVMIAGGTASGKTSFLNALMPFFPANNRILTIEDTRELELPEYLHWVPLTTRPPNPHGEGEVSMLDLIENSLRMRPDRIVVGEVRRRKEAEVLFEAMHTGHSVYASFHATRASEVVDRITTPPMDIPGMVMGSLHIILVQFRNRRMGYRRTFEVAELIPSPGRPKLNIVYQWDPSTDTIRQTNPSIRVKEELKLFTGMSGEDMNRSIAEKAAILEWLLANDIKDINDVGRIVAEYYKDKQSILDLIKSDAASL